MRIKIILVMLMGLMTMGNKMLDAKGKRVQLTSNNLATLRTKMLIFRFAAFYLSDCIVHNKWFSKVETLKYDYCVT
jgi:hypothetical protein